MYQNLLFDLSERTLHQRFLSTDLGQLYLSIPWEQLAAQIPAPRRALSGKGCKPWFDVKGGIGLQILKHYLGLSDALLIERINTDWSLQLFCGIQLRHEQIRDKNLVSAWRCYLSEHIDIDKMQQVIAQHWKPYLQQRHVAMCDATVFESRISYPTDIKLLWESIRWTRELLTTKSKELRLRKPRCNYAGMKKKYLRLQKLRKKSRKKEKRLRKSLLRFLNRLLARIAALQHQHHFNFNRKQQQRLKTIATLYEQQWKRFAGNQHSIQDRIVSLSKPYLRPIIRGKDAKPVEFGVKAHLLQVDGINFIEHLSYDPYNEGTRLEHTIFVHRKLFGRLRQLSADKIYATNSNRAYCKLHGIATNFIPKGKQYAHTLMQSAALRRALDIARGSRMEGSFGNEKNHYLLGKIAARNRRTETCWIFFGIFTANAVQISHRMKQQQKTNRAA